MMRSGLALGLSLAFIGIAPALGQEGKIAHGRAIALRVCAICHVVADDQAVAPTRNPPAPSLFSLMVTVSASKASTGTGGAQFAPHPARHGVFRVRQSGLKRLVARTPLPNKAPLVNNPND